MLFNSVNKYDWLLHIFLIEQEYEERFNSDCIDVNRTRRNNEEEGEHTIVLRVEAVDASAFHILIPTYVDYSEKIQFKLAKKDTFNIN